jgi:hypothetical protein
MGAGIFLGKKSGEKVATLKNKTALWDGTKARLL